MPATTTPRAVSSLTTLRLGVVGSVLVLLGGLVISAVPHSSWVADLAWRHSMPGRMSGLVVVVGGLGLLSAAWVRLWRAAGHGHADLHAVRRATVLFVLPLLVAPPLFSRDGWSYAAQGELTRLGLSPYTWGPGVLSGPVVEAVDPRWLATPTPYGPLPLLWGSGTARLVDSPWAMVVGHRLLALVGLALLAWALPRLAAWTRHDPAFVSALVLPSPLVLAHGVGGLHNDLLMVGLGAAALVVAAERGWVLGAATGGLAAAVKLPGGLVCLGVVLLSLHAGPACASAWAGWPRWGWSAWRCWSGSASWPGPGAAGCTRSGSPAPCTHRWPSARPSSCCCPAPGCSPRSWQWGSWCCWRWARPPATARRRCAPPPSP
ncbi:polyprenol phosphomannose-dependent alpha 1,6 mannosyltransferase MptB [Nocardioides marinisabuli]|uniref:polyprenol phosphomannose-dependent alpha 1,6 mannosyltransferase MptB n=1 Tax=Nocardioides marinisabuli TaxID=419476 RepID=UPI0015DF849C|nr:polyprenol phosphomannose-dependent alpha 1,6 mannosyltransferase MptB [Nocardioides marinisabuli]